MELKRAILASIDSAVKGSGLRFTSPVDCIISTCWGDPMRVVLPEAVSNEIATRGVYELDFTLALIQLLEPGMVFFDVGAHRGYFSLLASRLVGDTGQVHAFEPTPETYLLLSQNVQQRSNVICNNLAVYSESKELAFNDFGIWAPAFNSLYAPRMDKDTAARMPVKIRKVQAVSVDDYVARSGVKPDLIKIDAESAEMDILKGMSRTLETLRPSFTLETGDEDIDGVASSKELVEFACTFGYTPINIVSGTVTRHQIQDRYSYGNLLFVASELIVK